MLVSFWGHLGFIFWVMLISCLASLSGLFIPPFFIIGCSSGIMFLTICCQVVVVFGDFVDHVWQKPENGNINKTLCFPMISMVF